MAYKRLAMAAGAAALIALAEQPAAAQSGVAAQAPPMVVNTTVNLRQGPGTTYTVINKIPAGAAIDVGNCSGQWCQVTWQGQNGYVIATSLAEGNGGAPPPRAPPPGVIAGAPPPPPPGYDGPDYGAPPPYYGPYYYGYGPHYGRPYYSGYGYGYGHRHW